MKRAAALRRAVEEGNGKEAERERRYTQWKPLTRDQKEVAKRLAHGEGCDYVHDGSWGFFDRFLIFLREIGYLATLDLDGEGYERRMITIAKLLLTYQARVLLGIDSVNKIPPMLFGDVGPLMTLGWTAMQIKEGVCNRGKGKHKGPIHPAFGGTRLPSAAGQGGDHAVPQRRDQRAPQNQDVFQRHFCRGCDRPEDDGEVQGARCEAD